MTISIASVKVPGNAAPGSQVSVEVNIQNTGEDPPTALPVMITARYGEAPNNLENTGFPIFFTPHDQEIQPGTTGKFLSSFTMPDKKTYVHVWAYLWFGYNESPVLFADRAAGPIEVGAGKFPWLPVAFAGAALMLALALAVGKK